MGRGGIFLALAGAALLAACSDSEPVNQTAGTAAPPATDAGAAGAAGGSTTAPAGEDRADLLAHGQYLVETVAGCGNCHTPHNPDGSLDLTRSYSGAFVITEPVFNAYAPNITPDMETGIGSWSEDDIVHAVRNGIRPDGRFLGPPMSFGFYRSLSDRDVRAIAAFIKQVPAIRNEVPRSTFEIPLNGYGPIVESVAEVPRTDLVKYGEYLAGPVGHCMDCHTTYVMGQIQMDQLGRGGNPYRMPFGLEWTAVSANITPHMTDGLGAWTDDEIKRAITDGVSRNGRQLLPFMPFGLYANIRDEDLDAIVAYLRSIPPLPAAPAPAAEGAAAEE